MIFFNWITTFFSFVFFWFWKNHPSFWWSYFLVSCVNCQWCNFTSDIQYFYLFGSALGTSLRLIYALGSQAFFPYYVAIFLHVLCRPNVAIPTKIMEPVSSFAANSSRQTSKTTTKKLWKILSKGCTNLSEIINTFRMLTLASLYRRTSIWKA